MENNVGTEKGIPFNKWKDNEFVKKHKDLLKNAFDKIISEPSKNEKYKKFVKNIRRVGLK
jgi:hypothetical protein